MKKRQMCDTLTESTYQTKQWRLSQDWYDNGKRNECEKFQRTIIENITGAKCDKCSHRFNFRTFDLQEYTRPMVNCDGLQWSEDFDGLQQTSNAKYFFNLKMVCDNGGAQTRTLREVWHFIEAQLNYLKKHKNIYCHNKSVYFVNILDGDRCKDAISKDQFNSSIYQKDFPNINNYIYIGDLYNFKCWYDSIQNS